MLASQRTALIFTTVVCAHAAALVWWQHSKSDTYAGLVAQTLDLTPFIALQSAPQAQHATALSGASPPKFAPSPSPSPSATATATAPRALATALPVVLNHAQPTGPTNQASISTLPTQPIQEAQSPSGQVATLPPTVLAAKNQGMASASEQSSGSGSSDAQSAMSVPDNRGPQRLQAPISYPLSSRSRGEQGRVGLLVCIDAQGQPARVEVAQSSGFAALDRAAADSARQWRYSAEIKAGVSQASCLTEQVDFRLNQ